jgi:tRNA dimethylallyltransferase
MNKPLAVFLMGPTASGKTAVAVQLVQRLPLELISVDSALVYRGMDIGTAKPDRETLRRAPHRLINIRDPSEPYSAAQFRDDALREMDDICARGNTPLLVGGTMLYFRALEKGLSELPGADPEIRARLETQARSRGWQALHRRLAGIDPAAAARIHPNDPQRIQRALEVYELTGMSLSELYRDGAPPPATYRFLKIVLAPREREILHRRIEQRLRDMLEQGFLDEVRTLYERGDLDPDLPSMRAVGYRQAWGYLAGELSAGEWQQRALTATRQYAKRQLTWLRAEDDTHWVDPEEADAVDRIKALIDRAGAPAA